VKKRIVAALSNGDAPIKELAEFTGAERGTIRNKLSELMQEGVVTDAGYKGREKVYSLCGGPDFVTPDEDEEAAKEDYPDNSLLSSSPNTYRDSGSDDNKNDAQTRRSENKEVQTLGSALQEEPTTVAAFFANPPDWLPGQLEVYRENPERHFKPLCVAVSAVVLGEGLRWEEVGEDVTKELKRGEEGPA
jgi:DNA-binding Lrp family transcriptional regulator